jgi:Tfp pilus assembly protein FimT
MDVLAGRMIKLIAKSDNPSPDFVKISRRSPNAQSVEVTTSGESKTINLKFSQQGTTSSERNQLEINNLNISQKPTVMALQDNLGAMEVRSENENAAFEVELARTDRGRETRVRLGRQSIATGEQARILTHDWKNLENTTIERSSSNRRQNY